MSVSGTALEAPRAAKRQKTRRSSERLESRSSTASASSSSSTGSSRTRSTSCSPAPLAGSSSQPTRLKHFLAWCRKEGIHIEPNLDLRYSGDATSWSISIHALSSIANDVVVATIPKTAVLSRKTSALSTVLHGKYLSESHETVGLELALCLLYERCLGPRSRFEPFLSILPRLPVPLPFLRDPDDSRWRWLTWTESERIDKRASHSHHLASASTDWPYDHDYGMCKQKALDYFHDVAIPVLARSKLFDRTQRGHLDALEGAFLTAYTHVSSRDFIVDAYHGVGLVPVADLFNHTEVHTVQFESDQDVCEICGVALLTGHEEKECMLGSGEDDAQDDDEENSAETASEASRASGTDEQEPGPDEDDEDIEHLDTLDMRTLASHSPGEEMYNTYGPLTNALMLTRYGFCLDTETDVERFTLDLRFPSEREAFFRAFTESSSNRKRISDVSSDFQRVLTAIAARYPQERSDDEDEQDVAPHLQTESTAIDALYNLDHLFPSPTPDWLAPLFRSSPTLNPELDEDLVDRDHVHPLFCSATGRISTPLFVLTYLVHVAAAPGEKPSLDTLGEVKVESDAVQRTLRTLRTFWSARLEGLYVTSRVEEALQRLEDSGVEYIEKACIQHAYQEYVAVQGAVSSLEDLIS